MPDQIVLIERLIDATRRRGIFWERLHSDSPIVQETFPLLKLVPDQIFAGDLLEQVIIYLAAGEGKNIYCSLKKTNTDFIIPLETIFSQEAPPEMRDLLWQLLGIINDHYPTEEKFVIYSAEGSV